MAKYGRDRDQLKVLPAATFVLADTDAEAHELADVIRHQQVSGQTAIRFLEQLWNRDLSGYDPDGPLPDDRPRTSASTPSRAAGPACGCTATRSPSPTSGARWPRPRATRSAS
jgi:alkanesulfonate monooxygenase SsuD/methylene tetrahydromethanopterin reductase-like flavin-dependent oxidoreductase (luciferase family)